MELLEINHLYKNYDDKEVLKDINLKLKGGKIIGLLGQNGAGKSTLIKLINDLLIPTKGNIKVNGNDIGVETKKIISYLPERTYLNKNMTVNEVINYFNDFYDNLSSNGLFFFWIIVFLFVFLIFLLNIFLSYSENVSIR